jgi:type II secretory pathway pseudopilin PulG
VAAFTLAEVAVVAAIVGVLAALGFATLDGVVARARALTALDEVEATVRRARNQARLQRRCVRVEVERTRITVIPLRHRTGPPADCSGGDDDNAARVQRVLPPTVQLTPRAAVLFNRTGALVGNDPQSIVVTVAARNVPTRVVFLQALPGAGSIVRRG